MQDKIFTLKQEYDDKQILCLLSSKSAASSAVLTREISDDVFLYHCQKNRETLL